MQTWEDVRLAEKDLPLFALAPLADGPGRSYGPLPEETFTLFRAHGLSARDCAGCGAPVTDRHPHWPGVLVSVESEYGPVCDRSRLEGESVQRVGHILDATQARPAGKYSTSAAVPSPPQAARYGANRSVLMRVTTAAWPDVSEDAEPRGVLGMVGPG
ncbi:hypothetical protein AB0M94_37595 [Streptomyces xanthochromogenes]|uniref:hypothetical protein n=1 Tax=Streptomyces xanthochromogenes TaxID=67384 RepID=UPI0034435E4E